MMVTVTHPAFCLKGMSARWKQQDEAFDDARVRGKYG